MFVIDLFGCRISSAHDFSILLLLLPLILTFEFTIDALLLLMADDVTVVGIGVLLLFLMFNVISRWMVPWRLACWLSQLTVDS